MKNVIINNLKTIEEVARMNKSDFIDFYKKNISDIDIADDMVDSVRLGYIIAEISMVTDKVDIYL